MRLYKIDPKEIVVRYQKSWWDVRHIGNTSITIVREEQVVTLEMDKAEVYILETGIDLPQSP